jgi:hypothetical protein
MTFALMTIVSAAFAWFTANKAPAISAKTTLEFLSIGFSSFAV